MRLCIWRCHHILWISFFFQLVLSKVLLLTIWFHSILIFLNRFNRILRKQIRSTRLQLTSRQSKSFNISDHVLLYMHNEYRGGHYRLDSKKMISPFQIIQKINNNIYMLDMPNHTKIMTFSVEDLFPYYLLDSNSMSSSLQVEWNDVEHIALEYLKGLDRVKTNKK